MNTFGDNIRSGVDNVKHWWNDFSLQSLSERIGGSSAEAVQAALFFGIAFVSGFLFRKYATLLVIVFIALVISIKTLEYNELITLHWDNFYTLTGLEAPVEFNTLMKISFAWVKQNILLTVAASLGFLVGYKLA